MPLDEASHLAQVLRDAIKSASESLQTFDSCVKLFVSTLIKNSALQSENGAWIAKFAVNIKLSKADKETVSVYFKRAIALKILAKPTSTKNEDNAWMLLPLASMIQTLLHNEALILKKMSLDSIETQLPTWFNLLSDKSLCFAHAQDAVKTNPDQYRISFEE